MAVTALNSTTSSAALTVDTNDFQVASTANISVGQVLVASGTGGQEVMKVQAIPVSGRVQVMRGVAGTRALAHRSGVKLWIGAPDAFRPVSGTAPSSYIGLVGTTGTVPDYALPGTRATDGAGNQYVMVDLTFPAFAGVCVLISHDGAYTGSALASGDGGSVGIVTEEGTSDQWVWAQIYGSYSGAQFTSGSSLMTSTGVVESATTASVPPGALLGRTTSQASSGSEARIFGIYPASAVTTATTAATSATGYKADVWLNYPFVERSISSAP